MKMNVKRLNIIAEWLEAGAPHKDGISGFDMSSWSDPNDKWRCCGTACCIGGAADQWFVKGAHDAYSVPDIMLIERLAEQGNSKAAKALGLDGEKAVDLFFPERNGIYMHTIDAPWAARCIRKLIATGEVDWEGTR